MKKLIRLAAMFAMVLCACGIFAACGEKQLTSISVDTSTIKTSYVVGDAVDTYENAKVYAHYEDGSKVEVDLDDVTFSTITTTQSGEQTLIVTYKEKTYSVEITVYNSIEHSYQITGFEKPDFVVVYESNIESKTNKETEFYDRTQTYTVGDDNEFVFLPDITVLNESGEMVTLNAYKSVATVYEKSGNEYNELVGADLTAVVAIDDEKSTFDFTESAINRTFKISVVPYYYPEFDAIEFEFVVKDGYNIYSANQLAVFDSYDYAGNDETDVWAEFKANKNLPTSAVNAIFLHNNINITKENVASGHFYQSTDADLPAQSDYEGVEVVGSLRDYSYVYLREIAENQTFTFNGNYFTVDASAFPLVAKFRGDSTIDKITHACLFKTTGKGTFDFCNVNLVGNANRTEDITKAGGLILSKAKDGVANYTNIIATAWLTTYFAEGNYNDHTGVDDGLISNITKCKTYDNFSSIIYAWGENTVTIEDCELKRCGGPLAILCHVEPNEDKGLVPVYNVDSDTVLESYVTGQEAWFNIMGASALATVLKGFDASINAASQEFLQNKTFIKTVTENSSTKEVLNVLAVVMHCDGPMATSTKQIKGEFNYGEVGLNMNSNEDYNNYIANYCGGVAPILQSGGKTLFSDGTNMYKVKSGEMAPSSIDASDIAFFQGKYLGLSKPLVEGSSYTGILLEFFDKAE